MGYSVCAIAKNKALLDKMVSFLAANYQPWSKLIGCESEYVRGPCTELAYCHFKNQIGFDYSCGTADREYAWRMAMWMALKIGKLHNKGKLSLHFFYYDDEITYLYPQKIAKELGLSTKDCCIVDDLGKPDYDEVVSPGFGTRRMLVFLTDARTEEERINQEILRLDGLWEKET